MNEEDIKEIHDKLEQINELDTAMRTLARSLAVFHQELIYQGVSEISATLITIAQQAMLNKEAPKQEELE